MVRSHEYRIDPASTASETGKVVVRGRTRTVITKQDGIEKVVHRAPQRLGAERRTQ